MRLNKAYDLTGLHGYRSYTGVTRGLGTIQCNSRAKSAGLCETIDDLAGAAVAHAATASGYASEYALAEDGRRLARYTCCFT
ncbi:MAG: hypothetical protein NTZ35_03985 [Ignavibacteriales bacterium]|nr:hypothetical protein [Ignavibacteriales bacterium]